MGKGCDHEIMKALEVIQSVYPRELMLNLMTSSNFKHFWGVFGESSHEKMREYYCIRILEPRDGVFFLNVLI